MECAVKVAQLQEKPMKLPKLSVFKETLPLRQDTISELSNDLKEIMICPNITKKTPPVIAVNSTRPEEEGTPLHPQVSPKLKNAEKNPELARTSETTYYKHDDEEITLRGIISFKKPTPRQFDTMYMTAYKEPDAFPTDSFSFKRKTPVSSNLTFMNHYPHARSAEEEYKKIKFTYTKDMFAPRESFESIPDQKFPPYLLNRPLPESILPRDSYLSRNYRGPLIYRSMNSKKNASKRSVSKTSVNSRKSISKTNSVNDADGN